MSFTNGRPGSLTVVAGWDDSVFHLESSNRLYECSVVYLIRIREVTEVKLMHNELQCLRGISLALTLILDEKVTRVIRAIIRAGVRELIWG